MIVLDYKTALFLLFMGGVLVGLVMGVIIMFICDWLENKK